MGVRACSTADTTLTAYPRATTPADRSAATAARSEARAADPATSARRSVAGSAEVKAATRCASRFVSTSIQGKAGARADGDEAVESSDGVGELVSLGATGSMAGLAVSLGTIASANDGAADGVASLVTDDWAWVGSGVDATRVSAATPRRMPTRATSISVTMAVTRQPVRRHHGACRGVSRIAAAPGATFTSVSRCRGHLGVSLSPAPSMRVRTSVWRSRVGRRPSAGGVAPNAEFTAWVSTRA